MATEKRNIDEICTRLAQGTLASELTAVCRDQASAEERAKALRDVLQRRLDVLLAGVGDGEVPQP